MVQADVGDGARFSRGDHVGGIQAPAHSRFQHHDVAPGPHKVVEGHAKRQLKKRRRAPVLLLPTVHKRHHISLWNHPAVNPDPFPKVHQVRRREKADAVASALQRCGHHVAHRALAVGACHMHEFELALGMTQGCTHPFGGGQVSLVRGRTLALEHGELGKQNVDRLRVGHLTQGRTGW